MSQELHLVTRQRPTAQALTRALAEATGSAGVSVAGNFDDPDSYLNVSGPDLWFELEAPGHAEILDLAGSYPGDVILPGPDDDGCLWLTTATIPASAPSSSADVAWTVLSDLATRYGGVAIKP